MAYKRQTRFDTLTDLNTYQSLEERHIDGVDSRDPMNSWRKAMFRRNDEWKWFCKTLLEKRPTCERCGGDGADCSGLQVHHKDPAKYDDLSPDKFAVLCGRCHLLIESFCTTDEQRKRCPNIDKRFLTYYPYVDTTYDVLAKSSGQFLARRWKREIVEDKKPGTWINVQPVSENKKAEIKDAVKFMKEHPEMFK